MLENVETLEVFTKAITRAHGKSHPEVFKVRELFEAIQSKMERESTDLHLEFAQLRAVTNNYTIPKDVCRTYAAVYQMLSEADQTYNRKGK